MVNHLSMADVQTILTLHKSGHSNREIAKLVGVHRETVARYLTRAGSQNRPNAPPGSGDLENHASGPESTCEAHRAVIIAKLEQGLSAQRIWQDLV